MQYTRVQLPILCLAFYTVFFSFTGFVPGESFFKTQNQQEGAKYLQNVAEKFSAVHDYIVDVRVHLDVENVKAEDMEAKIYYKEPDRVKMDSKGIFVLPREVGIFNPHRFNPANFDVNMLDTLTYDGDPAVRVSVAPKNNLREQNIILTVDKRDWLIKQISFSLPRGGKADARISYGVFDNFQLPTEIDVNFDAAKGNSAQGGFADDRRLPNAMKGRVEIYYSNYKVNSGLSDSLFVKEPK
jgi:outer membrane lipoprotein-sorting protein